MTGLKKDKSGFTLIEVIIAILLSGIVITAVYQIMTASANSTGKTNDIVAEANALDSTMENIRALVMSSDKVTICDGAAASPAEGESVIKCVENVVYADDRIIGSASQYGVHRIELIFKRGSENALLDVELNSYDENGGILEGKSRSMNLYLHSLGGDGKGTIDTTPNGKNCIVFSDLQSDG